MQQGAASKSAPKSVSPFQRKMWDSSGLCFTALSKMEDDITTCYSNRGELFHWRMSFSSQAERQDLLFLTLMNKAGKVLFHYIKQAYAETYNREFLILTKN